MADRSNSNAFDLEWKLPTPEGLDVELQQCRDVVGMVHNALKTEGTLCIGEAKALVNVCRQRLRDAAERELLKAGKVLQKVHDSVMQDASSKLMEVWDAGKHLGIEFPSVGLIADPGGVPPNVTSLSVGVGVPSSYQLSTQPCVDPSTGATVPCQNPVPGPAPGPAPAPGPVTDPAPGPINQPPPPTTPPPIPPITPPPSQYWCMRQPGQSNSQCVSGSIEYINSLVSQGWTLQSGPYASYNECQSGCGELIDTDPNLYWCLTPPGALAKGCYSWRQSEIPTLIQSGWQLWGGPFLTGAQCQTACINPPPPIETQQWYCLNNPTGGVGCFYLSASGLSAKIGQGFTVRGGPYEQQINCVQACLVPPPPATKFRCVARAGEIQHCEQVTLQDITSILSSGGSVGQIEYDSAADCAVACQPPPPPPIDIQPPPPPPIPPVTDKLTGWWCYVDEQGVKRCEYLELPIGIEPPVIGKDMPIGGPYPTQEECEKACIPKPPPPPEPPPKKCYWCVKYGTMPRICIEGDCEHRPAFAIGGPYETKEQCQAVCKEPAPQIRYVYYCIKSYDGGVTCQSWPDTEPPPPGAVSGPWPSLVVCQNVCRSGQIQPSPPPPPPIPPIIIPGPPPQACCPLPEPPKPDKWRAWKTCSNVCYVTGPNEGPRDAGDTLLCEGENLSQALACLPPDCKACITSDGKTDEKVSLSSVNFWNDLDACKTAASLTYNLPPGSDELIHKILGDRDSKKWIEIASKWFGNPTIEAVVKSIVSVMPWMLDGGFDSLDRLLFTGGCFEGSQKARHLAIASANWLERITAADLKFFKAPLDYWNNFNCPFVLPTEGQATQAWLANEIDETLRDCWVRANGILPTPWAKIAKAARTKLSPLELLGLLHREIITEEQFATRIRELGHIEAARPEEYKALGVVIPTLSDLLRFLVRDVADEGVGWETADELFQSKWPDTPLEKWAKDQGIHPDYAKYAWRAHFRLPSPTQFFEFLHRLYDRPELWNGVDPVEAIREGLIQDDYHPKWVDHYIAISYRPLTRVDIRRVYKRGIINREQVRRAYRDLGYDEQKATTLEEFTVAEARASYRGHRAVRLYLQGAWGSDRVRDELRTDGARNEDIDDTIAWARRIIGADTRRKCTKGIRARLLTGEVNEAQAVQLLVESGLDEDQSTLFVQGWICEFQSRPKAAQASTLCKWLEQGLIDGVEFYERLLRLGWNRSDAARLIAECENRIAIKLDREERKRRRDQANEAAKEERDRKKADRELAATAARLAKAAQARETAQDRRDAILVKASSLLAARWGLPVTSAELVVRDGVKNIRARYEINANEAVRAALKAAEDDRSDTPGNYLAVIEEYGSIEVTVETVTAE